MPIYVIHDGLKDAALQEWMRPRAAVISLATPGKPGEGGEHHFWHASASSSTSESAFVSAAWAGTVFILPSGAVSDALKVTLQPNTHPAYHT
jgi:hypothetical protein